MQDYKKLRVWEKSHWLALEIYRITANFPKEEQYGLTSQLRRSAISISTNIAEGCGRGGNYDLQRFLSIAIGSAMETECLILLARDLGFLSTEGYQNLAIQIESIRQMLIALYKKTKKPKSNTFNFRNRDPESKTQNSKPRTQNQLKKAEV